MKKMIEASKGFSLCEVSQDEMKTYPLSPFQMSIFLEMMQHPQSTQFNLRYILPLPKDIDLDQIEQALKSIYAARPEWRIRFLIEGDEPRQTVDNTRELKVKRFCMSESECMMFMEQPPIPFDLFNDCLWRFSLIEMPHRNMFYGECCHAISDGVSISLGFSKTDMPLAYEGKHLPEIPFGMLQLAEMQEKAFHSPSYENDKDYFIQHFQGCEVLTLAGHVSDPIGKYIRHSEQLSREEVNNWSTEQASTPPLLFMAAFAYAASVAGRTKDFCFTTINHGRPQKELWKAQGLFIRNIPLRATIDQDMKAIDFIKSFGTELNQAFLHSTYPFTHFCQDLNIRPTISFSFQGGKITESMLLKGKYYPGYSLNPDSTDSDLFVVVYETDSLYDIRVEASDKLYNAEFLQSIAQTIKSIAEQMMTHPEATLSEIAIVSPDDQTALINLVTGEKRDYDTTKTLINLFHEQADKTPDAVAVIDIDSQYTYQELDRESDALACLLIDAGVNPGDHVCVELPRRKEFLLAVFGIMKAGAAYVPIDMEYPEDRKQFIIEDSEAKLVIDSQWLKDNRRIEKQRYPNDKNNCQLSTAYIIYTSGSTGQPKGVMVPHQALSHFVQFIADEWRLTAQSRISCHAPFAFDASVEDLYPVLTVGGTVCIVPEEATKDLTMLHRFIIDNHITGGCYTTQLGQMLLQEHPDLPLDYLVVGGERMTISPECHCRLINTYGPTEFAVDATWYELEPGRQYENIPIGRPLHNQTAYIIDEDKRLLPRDMAGELCLAGIQMATGYWKREELTKERFTDITVDGKSVKVYRTGDLCRWNEEGQLEYIGRIDQQVKLRGFRIELGEIESQAVKYEGVSQAVATVHDGQLLCLYYVKNEELIINNEELREFLAKALPDYMVPAVFIQLEELPLTPNGKVDRKRLPEPEMAEEEIVMPATPLEQRLFDITSERLGTERFGVTTDLISVGLSSIAAMRLSIAIHQQTGYNLPVRDILSQPTVRQMARAIEEGVGTEQVNLYDYHILQEYYPLTENQRGVYIDWEMNRDTTQYNIPHAFRIKDMDAQPLAEALRKVVDAHGYIKTRFVIHDGEVMQQRRDEEQAQVSVTILEQEPDAAFFQSRVRPFNPFEDDLYRLEVYAFGNDAWLFKDFHHLVSDGISEEIFYNDLIAVMQGEDISKEEVTAFDFALYEQDLRKSERFKEAQGYFDELLGGTEPVSYPHSSALDKTDRKADTLTIDIADGELIRKACRSMGVTENAYFQTALTQVLHRITREDSIMLATISGGRQLGGMERMAGMFARTIPLVSVSQRQNGQTFAEATKAMHRQGIESVERDFYPLTDVVERHGLKPQILYTYQGGLYDGVNLPEEGDVSDIPLALDTQKMPIELTVWYNGKKRYTISVSYDTASYCRADMTAFVKALANFSVHATRGGIALDDVEMVTEEERTTLIKLGTGTRLDLDIQQTFVSAFETQAAKTPESIAVTDEADQLTYAELSHDSDLMAQRLICLGVRPDDFVCVMLDRVKEFPLSVIGIMKAGAAYVPMDTEYPAERLQYMLEDSRAKALVTSHDLLQEKQAQGMSLPDGIHVMFIDDMDFSGKAETVNLSTPDGLAYMIYTSGSTGKPKGAMLQHAGLWNFIGGVIDMERLTQEDRIAGHRSFAFDAHIEDMYPILTIGGSFHIMPSAIRHDLQAMRGFLFERKITGGGYATAVAKLMLDTFNDLPVRFITAGGETLEDVYSDHIEIINVYGPTECTDDTSYYKIPPGMRTDRIPIGKSFPNTYNYITDAQGRLLPQGIPGELCTAGIQVGRGYWHQPEQTAEVFSDCPFVGKDYWGRKLRMYRTGDLCRWNEEGQLEYLGRIDQQVKLRGFRIELGEIESQALKFEGISQAVAAVHDGQLLCLYYVENEKLRINNEELKEFLSKSLPDYMVPAVYISLDELPLTPNGKVDRKKLPAPDMTSDTEYVAPEGETEQKVAGAFAEVLNLTSPVGALDNFFSLGGDSIKSIRLVSRLRSDGIVTQVADVMRLRTVRAIAAAARHDGNTLIPQETVTGEVDPNPVQQEFFQWNLPKPEHFNQAVALRSLGPVNAVLLRQALEALAVHHDMLRAAVRDGKIIIRDIGEGQLVGFCEPEKLHTVDLKNGPILKASLQHSESGDILLLACHHISCDGVSWRIITEDLNTAYRQLLEGKPVKLPPKTHSFAHYTRALRRYRDSHLLMREKPYWQKVQERMERPGLAENVIPRGERRTLDVSLGGESIRRLLTTANHAYNTDINDLLVTALCQAYRQLTGQADVVIQMEGHGREPIHEPLVTDRTVGWFTSVYPLAVEGISGDTRHDIRLVKETFRAVPGKGLGYGILQYIPSVKGDGNLRTDLMPPIGFNYLGQMEENRGGDVLTPAPEIPTGQAVATENASSAPSLDINCIMEGGTFHAGMTYDTAIWTEEQAQALAEGFIKRLQHIASHTAGVSRTEPTASDIGAEGWTDEQFQAITDRFAARGEHLRRVYPLTPMQEAMLLEYLKDTGTTAYRLVFRYAVDTLPTEQALRAAMDWLAERHETLRTAIIYDGVQEPCQAIVNRRLPVAFIDLTEEPDIDEAAARIHRELQHRPLNLQDDPLFSLTCLKTSGSTCQLIFQEHHIITDGWSLPIYMGDFLNRLASEMQGRQLPATPAGHGRYERFVRDLHGKDMTAGLAYWKDLLQGYETRAEIPAYRKPTEQEARETSPYVNIELDKGLTAMLHQLAAKAQCTMNTVMELAWGLTLQACCRNNDAVFAKVVSGRSGTDMRTDGIVGLFINSVPVRVRTEDGQTIAEALRRLQAQAAESAEWDFCPLSRIQAQTDLGQALFQSTMAFENYPVPQGMDDTLKQWNFRPVQTEEEPFGDLDLSVAQQDDGIISLKFTYDTDLYPQEEMETVAQVLGSILRGMAENPEATLERLPLVGHEELQALVKLGAGEKRGYDTSTTLVDLFKEQAKNTPDAVAVIDIDSQFTYSELDQASDTLACLLIKEGIKAGDHVCVELPRRKEFLLAVFGILKSGAAYVPIDMEYPEDRKKFIIDDSEAKLVIDEAWLSKFRVESLESGTVISEEVNNVQRSMVNVQCSTAYIIYTSGSTGKPKGVVVSHRALSHFMQFIADEWRLTAQSRISCHAPFAFDASVEDLYPVLTAGGMVCIVPEEATKDLQLLHKFIIDNRITGGCFTTQIGQLLLQEYPDLPLDYMVVGGEKMTANPPCSCRLINTYGPTEFCVDATYYELEPGRQYDNIPIGRPLHNQTAYIIDSGKRLLPRGMAGELCLAGIQMATGYWKREELTNELFTDITVDGKPVKVYRTGDLCRWNEEGQLEYLGRIDQQVKLRGFRIELGEIENLALKFEGVRQAVATVHEGNLLCLYYTAINGLDKENLRNFLAATLPGYMVPAAYMQIDILPLTPNGKIDRKKLPEPSITISSELIPPANDMEYHMLRLAKELLPDIEFGVTDDLFRLGMTSLQTMGYATSLIKMGLDVNVASIMRHGNIRDILKGDTRMVWLYKNFDPTKPVLVFACGVISMLCAIPKSEMWSKYYNVVVINSLDLHYDTQFQNASYEDILSVYMTKTRELLPDDVRIDVFIGFSWGGELAWHLARRWQEATGQKAAVVMGDTILEYRDGIDINSLLVKPSDIPEETIIASKGLVTAEGVAHRMNCVTFVKSHDVPIGKYEGQVIFLNAMKSDSKEDIKEKLPLFYDIAPNLHVIDFPEHDHVGLVVDKTLNPYYTELLLNLSKHSDEK